MPVVPVAGKLIVLIVAGMLALGGIGNMTKTVDIDKISNELFDQIIDQVTEHGEDYVTGYQEFSYDPWDVFEEEWNNSKYKDLPDTVKQEVYKDLEKNHKLDDTILDILTDKHNEMYWGLVK